MLLSTDGSILIKQKVFSIRHRHNVVTIGCSQCKNVHSLHIFYFVKGVKYSTDGSILIKQKVFQSGTGIMPLQAVVRQCKNVHTLHSFYFVKGVKYSTDGKHFEKCFSIRHRHNAVASGCSVVRRANYLHNLYFIKKCVLPCKNFPMGTKYDRVFSKPY